MDKVWNGKWSFTWWARVILSKVISSWFLFISVNPIDKKVERALTSQPRGFPAVVLVIADVLNVLDHFWAQSVFPHDCQHLSVHQVMGSDAVGVTAVPLGEMLTDVEPFTRWLLVTNLPSTFSLIIFAYLHKRKRIARDKTPSCNSHTSTKESLSIQKFQKQAEIHQRKTIHVYFIIFDELYSSGHLFGTEEGCEVTERNMNLITLWKNQNKAASYR